MKKFLKTAWAVLLYLWQLPQNLLGLAYLAFCFDRVKIKIYSLSLIHI